MRKIIAAVLGLALFGQSAGFAAGISIERDIQNAKFYVSGTAEQDSAVTIGVYAPGTGPADIASAANLIDVLKYHDEIYADENGNFNLTIGFDKALGNTFPSGVYPMFVTINGAKTSSQLEYIEYAQNSAVLPGLAAATDMVTYINTNKNDLGFFNPLYDNVDQQKVADYMKTRDTSYAAAQDAVDAFNEAVIVRALSEGDIAGISAYESQLAILKGTGLLAKWYQQSDKTAVDAAISGKNYINDDAFVNAVTEAVVLNIVSGSSGYLTIQQIINDFASQIGIANPTATQSVYKNLSGKSYTSYSQLVTEYNKYLQAAQNQNTGGGGGGGGFGGAVNVSSGTIPMPAPATPLHKAVFTDMADAAWAEPAVEYLVDKEIVSGRSSEEFCPKDTVLREEFVTMIVRAFGFKKVVDTAEFSDVTPDKWYYDYVLAASQNEIVSGLGDGKFGAGEQITRQDMAAILYRVINTNGINIAESASAVDFADNASFAEYAKEAISYLQTRGVVSGMEDGSFCPTAFAQRAQAAQMIYKILIGMGE